MCKQRARLVVVMFVFGALSLTYTIIYDQLNIKRLFLTYPPMIYIGIANPLLKLSITTILTTLFLTYGIAGEVKPRIVLCSKIVSSTLLVLYGIACIVTFALSYWWGSSYFIEWVAIQLFYVVYNPYAFVLLGIILAMGVSGKKI